MDKKLKKKSQGHCTICKESDYNLLDCHRINPGSKYTKWGTLTLCSNCHRKVHSGSIEIIGKYNSTKGPILIYKDENKKEHIVETN